jgi:signal transduction histidine kinase/ActR/RegA family two-component response regulator
MSPNFAVEVARLPKALVRWFSELTYEGLFATDRDLQVIVWNRWMEEHTKRTAADALGRSLFELCPDIVARGLDQYYRDALSGRISVISYGLHRHILRLPPTNRDLGFDEMPQTGRIGPLSDGENVIGTVTTVCDISDRLTNESELRKQIEIQQMARVIAEDALRAKDEFLSTVSHEIRNPLNAVIGWTRILLDRKEVDSEMLGRALRIIDRNASAQARLIDDLLDGARIASGKLRLEMQPVDLLAVALAAIDVVSPSTKAKKLEVRTGLDPETPRVLGDQQRLQQIVGNLLSNAVKFTNPGGLIEVRVSPAGKLARLTVSDSGQGISPDFLPFVFDRFRQSDDSSARRHGGLGLGLALVRELVELHGGTVRAESAGENRGATFTIDLPTALSREVEGSTGTRDGWIGRVAPSLAGTRVLIVADDADSRDLVTEALSACGANVMTASSNDEALDVIRRCGDKDRPDVIVSDLDRREDDGFDIIRSLRSLEPAKGGRIPAIALFDHGNPEGYRCRAAGFHSQLAKPIEPVAIAEAVARAARDAAP